MRSPAASFGTGPAAAFVASAVAAVAVLGFLVSADLTDPVDAAIIGILRDDAVEAVLSPLRWVTEAGSTWAVTAVAVGLLVGLALARRPYFGALAALVVALASLGNSLLKALVARARPEALEPIIEERGFSFPSGHAALGMVAWGIVALVIARSPLPAGWRRAVVALLAVLVFLVGVSRIYLGVHFPSDVLAGWIAGAAVVVAFAAATRGHPLRGRWRTDLSRGASTERGAGAADADPAAPRSDRPAAG